MNPSTMSYSLPKFYSQTNILINNFKWNPLELVVLFQWKKNLISYQNSCLLTNILDSIFKWINRIIPEEICKPIFFLNLAFDTHIFLCPDKTYVFF